MCHDRRWPYLLLVEQICSRAAQIDDLRTPITIFFQPCTFEAVECIRDALTATHNAFVLVIAKSALVTDSDLRRGPHVRIADGTLAIALVTEPADGNASHFAAHDEIGVMTRHACLVLLCYITVHRFWGI